MLDAEEARLRALESTAGDDLLVVVAIEPQLRTPKRYLKICADDARVRAFGTRHKAETKGIRRTRRQV